MPCDEYAMSLGEEIKRSTFWPTIDSAPKDGTPILVARYDDTFGWVRGWAAWESVPGKLGFGKVGGWLARGFYDPPGELGLGNPTHWCPIPSPRP